MPQITLTRSPTGERVRISFTAETEFNVTPGPEDTNVVSLYQNGSQWIIHVSEDLEAIIHARDHALAPGHDN